MCKRVTDKLQIPIQVSSLIVKSGWEKSFAIYLYLKFHSSGKVHKESEIFQHIQQDLGIRDSRTYNKHFQRLVKLKWVGLSEKSGYYYIHGFDRIRLDNNFKSRQATTLFYKNLRNLRAFLVGSILGSKVNGQKYYWEVVLPHKLRPVAKKRDATNPASAYADRPKPDYYGLSLPEIADLLGCKKTRASQLRKLAADGGFIKVNPKFIVITTISKPDYNIRKYLYEQQPKFNNKLRFRKVNVDGVTLIEVILQTHHEIIPQLQFKTISKFNNLVVAPHIKTAAANRIKAAAKIAA